MRVGVGGGSSSGVAGVACPHTPEIQFLVVSVRSWCQINLLRVAVVLSPDLATITLISHIEYRVSRLFLHGTVSNQSSLRS